MESLATLNLWGSGGTAGHVTANHGMSPTRCVEAGEPIRPGSTKTAESSGWILHSDTEGPDVELDESLRNLLDKIEPRAEALSELEGESSLVVWRCVVATNDLEHDIELDRSTP